MKLRIISLILVICLCICTIFTSNIASAATMRGDVNSDGKYDAKDALILKKHLAGLAPDIDTEQADCNGDGLVNIYDLYAMQKYLVKSGELYYEVEAGWNTLIDWENATANTKPDEVYKALHATVNAKTLAAYGSDNPKNLLSKTALAIVADGIAKKDTSVTGSNGSNPNNGQLPTKITLDRTALATATNLRVTLNLKNTLDKNIYVAYIGCQIGSKTYYYPITVESYDDFNYFYFVGKDFYEYKNLKRKTYIDDMTTKTITADDIKNMRYLCFWMESDNPSSTMLIVDDIEYYEGGIYDSSAEDAVLKQPEEPVDDGTEKYLCISFDDGPAYYSGDTQLYFDNGTNEANSKYFMEYYLDLAKKYDAHFTFFLNGAGKLKSEAVNVLKRAVNEGSELANHTWSHPYLTSITFDERRTQVNNIDEWLSQNVGVTTKLLRPPFLAMDSWCYTNINKTAIAGTGPADFDYVSSDYAKLYYKKNLGDCSITLTHEPFIENVETVRWMLDYYSKLGYKFVTISELFEIKGITPASGKMYSVVK